MAGMLLLRRQSMEELMLSNWAAGEDSWRVPWKLRRSNQSIVKQINPEYSLRGLMLKLKLQYFGHLIRTANSLEKTEMLEKNEGRRRRGDRAWDAWMTALIQSMDINLGKLGGDVAAWHATVHGDLQSYH